MIRCRCSPRPPTRMIPALATPPPDSQSIRHATTRWASISTIPIRPQRRRNWRNRWPAPTLSSSAASGSCVSMLAQPQQQAAHALHHGRDQAPVAERPHGRVLPLRAILYQSDGRRVTGAVHGLRQAAQVARPACLGEQGRLVLPVAPAIVVLAVSLVLPQAHSPTAPSRRVRRLMDRPRTRFTGQVEALHAPTL